MEEKKDLKDSIPRIGLDMGIYSVKGVLVINGQLYKETFANTGRPIEAVRKCITGLLGENKYEKVELGITGCNAKLIARMLDLEPILEIEALETGLNYKKIPGKYVLSLGHENMYYMERENGLVTYFNRNGQCAAGSGSFWYQQATRMGYNDRELAEVALEAKSPVKISGRCAVFAKSDMTHAINEGATYSAVSAGLAKALVDLVITNVARNRIQGPAQLLVAGGVANNKAVLKYLKEYCSEQGVEVRVPEAHEYINALGASCKGKEVTISQIGFRELLAQDFVPDHPLPPLEPEKVNYLEWEQVDEEHDLSRVYLGVDCGSVSTKCALLDQKGRLLGGVYLPTAGRPALQVLELLKQVEARYGHLLEGVEIIACTTGSGRFLSQKILNAQYAADEITCQAEGVKYLFPEQENLAIIEIGGEDSKFLQIKDGILFDYNMNPVCAAGTGTFLENLAELLGVKIEGEFSQKAFAAEYAVDLGDICTLLSQSTLVSLASRGLPLESQLASLAYSSARNYLSRTVEKRPLDGKLIFTGATAKNHALASAFAAECKETVHVPPYPELSGAIGSAIVARIFHENGEEPLYSFRSLQDLNSFQRKQQDCRAECQHDHNCTLDVISFADGSSFIYGDRCGRYSGLEKVKRGEDLPDFARRREEIFLEAAGEPLENAPTVGIARAGLYYELFPFWSAFFRELGLKVVLSRETGEDTLEKGKRELDSEMCYPMEVIVGHYQELVELDPDYIFVPEVVNLKPLPWAEHWPRSFTCPLLQTKNGVLMNSLNIKDEKHLYAQLNYREGEETIIKQLEPVARKVLGEKFDKERHKKAVETAFQAQEKYRQGIEEASVEIMDEIRGHSAIVALFLGRSYTLYDNFVAKGSLEHARNRGLLALPHDFLVEYMRGWYEGRIEPSFLQSTREEFIEFMDEVLPHVENIYPAQLQRMMSAALMVKFLSEKARGSELPPFFLVLQDPFKCGPNAMLRHHLGNLAGFLRLTIDEHTAAAGMITRLEAFRNTCRSRKNYASPPFYSSRTRSLADKRWKRVLIPEPTRHAAVFASMFRNYGVQADILPRSYDADFSLARRYVNGEECLPFIQNLQDYLEYLENNPQDRVDEGTLFFQGWACGPCRYGMYAPTQSLLINRAGYLHERVCSVKLQDALQRFGLGFAFGAFAGIFAMDLLYKMLYSTRPYEKDKGSADGLFQKYSSELLEILEKSNFSLGRALRGKHLLPLEDLLSRGADEFSQIPKYEEIRPRILVAGEFYVRLDERCNQDIVRKIEKAGGEVSMAPASEIFAYTAHIYYEEAREAFQLRKKLPDYFLQIGYGWANKIFHRDEARLDKAASQLLAGLEEPTPAQIMSRARKYVSKHYGGEPPMTIGRTACFAGRERVTGAVFVAPFTCMPGSVVEAQQGVLQEELGIPVITIYYDGRENANREEFIQSLVFQASQLLKQK